LNRSTLPGSRARSALRFGLVLGLCGAILSLTPLAARIEEIGGLQWLFSLRGARPAPPGVVVVTTDRHAAEALGLPADPAKWPRSLHARLVRELAAAGARVIAFDIFFAAATEPAEDEAFALALREAGNVVLNARLDKRTLGDEAAGATAVSLQLQVPFELLRRNALAVAPFTLPAWPMKVSQFWTFHQDAGDRPTLPAVVVQALWLDAGEELAGVRAGTGPEARSPGSPRTDLVTFMQAVRDRFKADPLAGAALGERVASRPGDDALRRLVTLYGGPPAYFLNLFGPPLSVATVSYHEVLGGAPLRTADGRQVTLRDALVFVGFSARSQPEQRDSFFTAFSLDTGLNLSGVEIAATATANLIEGRTLRTPGDVALAGLACAWGLYLGFVCRLLRGAPGVLAGVASAAVWLFAAAFVFGARDLWLPVVIPIFVQVPLAVLGALLLQFQQVRDERQRLGTALGRYVPPQLIERLVAEGVAEGATAQVVHGTCMATDAAAYTPMAETLAPDDLGRMMNAYYDILFGAVETHGGQVSDVVGDAMMAIWASSRPDAASQAQACRAALDLQAELSRRAAGGDRAALPTRIGLHCGEISLGSIGARQHLEYRAVGDIVNTAARIENLNKHLGTRVLASAQTLAGVAGLACREVGTFLLPGKSIAIVVHELRPDGVDAAAAASTGRFAEALAHFRAARWTAAVAGFRACLDACPDDGPARYYLALCEDYLAHGPASFVDGAVRVTGK
jgi:adenylate cyclase